MEICEKNCIRCGKEFRAPALLKRHLERKTPCEPIIDATGKDIACRYCGKAFASRPSMSRHVRQYCKIANSDEGMEKLLDHTLQRQLTEQNAQLAEQSAQLMKLTSLIEKLALTDQTSQPIVHSQQVNNGTITNIVNIHPWDGDKRIGVELAHILAAFTDNAKLREYAQMGDHELTDPAIAPPYVTELLMDLTKRAHATPESRNVYLNPRRSDQVLILKKNGSWEVLPLADATRLIFDGVAATIHHTTMSLHERQQLPLEAQNALSMAGLLYDDEPEEYVKRAKAPMSAHLINFKNDSLKSIKSNAT
jgi:DNA-directed RNA polymerase subunit RPC12/RpoP